ncbi:MAG: phosphotransferase [Cyclobacteriaceae bacterium]|nr:phosphotransferase [Cyclobacteriaceae bacterium]
MKEQGNIPTGKVMRATRFVKAGAKIGGNYIKHYAKKMVDPSTDKAELDKNNAEDIYASLSELKGSALKVAQMMAMDKNLLPKAYQDKFAMAQYSAPPLSYPLVVKSFVKEFGKGPSELYESFTQSAVNAASIGQVHQANKNGKKLAVKIQYPGIADSIKSDLRIVRPFAMRLFNISDAELDHYFAEVEGKLIEETDYLLEVKRSIEISKACAHIDNVIFPTYYPEFSGERIITMDWMPGLHLKEFLQTNPSQEARNKIGQALWDFYDYQIYVLKQVHADPHPGNFLFRADGSVGILDFGCVKVIPEDFHSKYFKLIQKELISNESELMDAFHDLEFLHPEDTEHERKIFVDIFKQMISLLGKPFHGDNFDFGDDAYFNSIYALGEKITTMKEVRNAKAARGSRHGLYVNRTYFGLYNLLNVLKANIQTRSLHSVAMSA